MSTSALGSQRHPRRHKLRSRVVLGFVVGALALTVVLSVTTYFVARAYLTDRRVADASLQAISDARVVRDTLDESDADPGETLRSLGLPVGTQALLYYQGEWFGTGLSIAEDDLPDELRAAVAEGDLARQTVMLLDTPTVVTGVPIAAIDAQYFEVTQLSELERTLGVIRNTLFAVSVVAVIGSAFLGLWAARRVLRPISHTSHTAARIADGDLSIRLEEAGDRDLDELARSFNTMVNSLADRIAQEQRFVADVSHEIRSPLTTLATAAQLMEARRDDLPPESQTALDLLVSEIERFQQLAADLLELSRADSGGDALALAPVMFSEFIYHRFSATQPVRFPIDVSDEVAETPLLVDKHRIDRVLTNLIDNAFTYGGGVRQLSLEHRDDSLRIEVLDYGSGIPKAERAKIFERFHRGQTSGRRGSSSISGTGLGLSLVAEHVRLHNGRVWVEDGPESQGARFVVEVPWIPAN